MGFERNEDRRKRGQVSRYPGSQVPRAGARTSECQCHTVPSVAATGTKWSEVALKVGMRFQGRLVQHVVGLPRSRSCPTGYEKYQAGREGWDEGRGLGENRDRPPRRIRQTTDCVARQLEYYTSDPPDEPSVPRTVVGLACGLVWVRVELLRPAVQAVDCTLQSTIRRGYSAGIVFVLPLHAGNGCSEVLGCVWKQ